jgi:tetratricopeptide (TPR) repeat protein
VTRARAAGLAVGAALLVYLPALGNRFALDDGTIVERNPAAHSVGAALRAFDQSYWPAGTPAGQWRPLVILSFAADWELSSGSTVWLHAGNVLWHAAATALLVPILAAFVPAGAALAGGLLFAVHPVHVEAVANLVGRAELMAAVFLFLAVLIGRRVRSRLAAGRRTWGAEAGLIAAVAAALLSKEHAAVAVALLALDDLATRSAAAPALPARDYVAVVAVTAAWFVVRLPIDAGRSFAMVAPTFFGLGTVGRVSTMLPVVFVLIRVLVWPFDLSPDYFPAVVPRLEHPTPLGVAGLLLLLALVALTLVAWRRNRAVSAGLLLVGVAWLPTANLLFPTGIVLAERTLYLASAGLALVAAAAVAWLARRRGAVLAGTLTAAVVLAFAVRTALQVPVWRDSRSLLLWALGAHPESYRQHQAAARALVRLHDLPTALRQYAVSVELYPLDHYNLLEAGAAALAAGRPRLALTYLEPAERLDQSGLAERLLSTALLAAGLPGDALIRARRAAAAEPRDAEAARLLAASFLALHEPDSAVAASEAFRERGGSGFERWLLEAWTLRAVGRAAQARAALDSATRRAPPDSASRARLDQVRSLLEQTRHR